MHAARRVVVGLDAHGILLDVVVVPGGRDSAVVVEAVAGANVDGARGVAWVKHADGVRNNVGFVKDLVDGFFAERASVGVRSKVGEQTAGIDAQSPLWAENLLKSEHAEVGVVRVRGRAVQVFAADVLVAGGQKRVEADNL